MTLSSPNYPKWYDANAIGCEWLISAPEGFIIALEFNHFHVNIVYHFFYKANVGDLPTLNILFPHVSYMILLLILSHYMMALVITPKN